MTLTLNCPPDAAAQARAVLCALGVDAPEEARVGPPSDLTRDMVTMMALGTLILTAPPAVLAALEIKDRLQRRALKRALEMLKDRLAELDQPARLTFPSGASLDLARTGTDAAIDLILKELGA